MSVELCPMCRGLTTIAPLGGMSKKCPQCSGVGKIETVILSRKQIAAKTQEEHRRLVKTLAKLGRE